MNPPVAKHITPNVPGPPDVPFNIVPIKIKSIPPIIVNVFFIFQFDLIIDAKPVRAPIIPIIIVAQ